MGNDVSRNVYACITLDLLTTFEESNVAQTRCHFDARYWSLLSVHNNHRVKACSINPVDHKVRSGAYDDYPDYYSHVPTPFQIIGFDGAGIIKAVGAEAEQFKAGDEVFYSGSPFRHGSNAEYQLVAAGSIAKKPTNLSWEEAAAMPLTYITAYEALVERMEIKKGEKAAVLIINGAGGTYVPWYMSGDWLAFYQHNPESSSSMEELRMANQLTAQASARSRPR